MDIGFFSSTGFRFRSTRGYSGSSPSGLWFLPQKDLERWLFLFHRVSLSRHPGLFGFKPFRALVPTAKRLGISEI
jgi:hypothetical protein